MAPVNKFAMFIQPLPPLILQIHYTPDKNYYGHAEKYTRGERLGNESINIK